MLKTIIFGLIVSFVCFGTSISTAKAPDRTLREYSPQELVSYFAKQYSVSEHQMLVTMACESGFRTNAIGDSGKSFGLSQIHLPSNPQVTQEEALDKVYAVEFMAREFKQGHQRKWTCWRNNFL